MKLNCAMKCGWGWTRTRWTLGRSVLKRMTARDLTFPCLFWLFNGNTLLKPTYLIKLCSWVLNCLFGNRSILSFNDSSVGFQGMHCFQCNFNCCHIYWCIIDLRVIILYLFVDELNFYKTSLAVGRSGTWLPWRTVSKPSFCFIRSADINVYTNAGLF